MAKQNDEDAAERTARLKAARAFDPPEPDYFLPDDEQQTTITPEPDDEQQVTTPTPDAEQQTTTPTPVKSQKQLELEERRRRDYAEALSQQQQATVPPEPQIPPEHGQQEEKRLPRFVFITDDELEAMDIPPVEWIVDGLIPRVLVSSIVAQSGVGKTWIALDLARACSVGGLFLGQYPALKCRVGILDAEDEYGGLKTRWTQLHAGMGRLPDDRIKVRMLSGIGSFDVMNPAESDELVEAMRSLDLLIVDSLSQTHGVDEKDNSALKVVMQQWESLSRRTGCIVILIHHAGWGAPDRGRGGSVIRDRVQAELNITKDGDGVVTRIGQSKNKFDATRPNVATMRVDGSRKTPVRLIFGEAAMEATDQQRESVRRFVLDQLRGIQVVQQDLIDEAVNRKLAGKTTVYAVLTAMADEGAIIRQKTGRSMLCQLP